MVGGFELTFDLGVVLGSAGAVVILLLLAWWLLRGLPKDPDAPLSRRATVALALVEFFRDSILGGMSPGLRNKLFPLILTLFGYVLFCNWLSALPIPYAVPPTSNANVTVGLALTIYALSHYYGMRQKGLGHHLKSYLEPFPFLLPLNVIGDLGRTMSHGFRLFGNMLSGVLLMAVAPQVVGQLLSLVLGPGAGRWLTPPVLTPFFLILNGWFGLFAGLIQALVFTLLAVAYIQGSAE